MSGKSARKIGSIVLSVVAVLTMLLVAACNASPSASGDEKKVVGLDMYFRRDQWWQDLEKTALQTAQENGLELLVQDADADNAKQMQQLETFLSQNVDAIIYAPIDYNATEGIAADAAAKGIEVVCIELCLEDMSNISAYVQFDQEKAGYDMGLVAAQFLNDKFGGEGKVAMIYDTTNITAQVLRVKGFKAALAEKAPNAVVIAEQNGENNRDKSITITENILTANPDTVIWLGGQQDQGFGIIAALESKGVDPATVAVFAEGWGVETLEALAGDKQYLKAVMVTPSDQLARESVKAVAANLNSGTGYTKDILLQTDIVTNEKAVEYFKKYGIEMP